MAYKLILKNATKTESAVIAAFMKNGQRFKFYSGKTVPSKFWSDNKQCLSDKVENYKEINLYLETWEKELRKIIEEMEANQIRLSQESIKMKLDKTMKKDCIEKTKTEEVNDFISFMQYYINNKRDKKPNLQRLNQNKKNVIVAFNLITKKHMQNWNKLGSRQKSRMDLMPDFKLEFDDINIDFIRKFREYLYTAKFKIKINGVKAEQNYKINYIDKQIKTLKQFITTAIEAGYVKRFTWNTIKSESRDVDSIYTDFAEIQILFDEELENTEKLVRDKYVLNCFLGMRYSDLNKLESHFFQKRTISGKEFVVYTGRNQKTDQRIEFALHPMAQRILEMYNYDIPKLSSKEFNKKIKLVAHKAGLRDLVRIREIRGSQTTVADKPKYELMSSHTGRRSFCTNFYNEGVSTAAIMSISGHQTEMEFRKYVKKTSVRLEIVAEQVFAIQGLKTKLSVA